MSKTEDAIDALRSCNLSVPGLTLERQYVMLKHESGAVQMAFVDRSVVLVSATPPMDFVELGEGIPSVVEIEFCRCCNPGETFLDVWDRYGLHEVCILSVRLKYGVCPPIANHHFGTVNNHVVEFIENPPGDAAEDVVMDVLYHITDIWVKQSADESHRSFHYNPVNYSQSPSK